ncbi:MAG: serpin family protein [Propionibacteriaceae bacterium]|nr:serpin family protein [Propionibacteriaceae bacterium]
MASKPTAEQAKTLAGFAEKLFTQSALGDDNAVISPLSVFFALGLAEQGADGDTAKAFADVLGLDPVLAAGVASYLIGDLRDAGAGTTVNIANSAWLDDALAVEQPFVENVKKYFDAEVISKDLQGPGVVDEVNGWVSEQTNGLIPSIVDQIDASDVALLVNALYLKAEWETKFNTDLTSKGYFTRADGSQTEAMYMKAKGTLNYFSAGGAEGVMLPYKDGKLGFIAAKKTEGGVPALAGDSIATWLSAAQPTENVTLTMPKFETSYGKDLSGSLAALGLEVAFDSSRADFSKLGKASQGPIYIGQVLHKVNMAVGEEGTEAAAATVVVARMGSANVKEVIVSFDQPYLYAVVDLESGIPLFIGTLDDPEAAPPAVS